MTQNHKVSLKMVFEALGFEFGFRETSKKNRNEDCGLYQQCEISPAYPT